MTPPLLAEKDVVDLIQSEEFLWLVGAFVGVLLLGAMMFAWIERWRKRQLADPPIAQATQQLTSFRAMFERGEITPEEYSRIKAREAERLRNKIAAKPVVPAKPGQALPEQPATQEPVPPPPQPE